jgi:hypothetical protein
MALAGFRRLPRRTAARRRRNRDYRHPPAKKPRRFRSMSPRRVTATEIQRITHLS